VHGPASRHNKNEIKAEIEVLEKLMTREPKICGGVHPAPGERRYCGLALFNCCTMFDFNKHDAPPSLCDEVDFAKVRLETPREDAVAFGHEKRGCGVLREMTALERALQCVAPDVLVPAASVHRAPRPFNPVF
jgi:hypothetical protein